MVTAANAPNLGGSLTWGQILITNPGGDVTIGNTASSTLTLNGLGDVGIDMSSASRNLTINNPVTLGATQTWTVAAGRTLNVGAYTVDNVGNLLTVDVAGTINFGGNFIGSGGITKYGTGRFNFPNSALSYTGPTTINGGVLFFGDNTSWLGSGPLTLNGGVLEWRWGSTLTRSLGTSNGQMQILGGASGFSENGNTGGGVTINNNAAYEVIWGVTNEASNASATGYFNPSTLVLQTPTSQQGSSMVFANKIDLNASTRTISTSKGTTGAATATLSGVIRTSSGTAGLTKTGDGTLVLSAANTYNGTTTVSNGVLRLSNANALPGGIGVTGGTSALILDGGVVELANGHFLRNVGTGSAQFQITGGASGFSANGAARNVNVNNTASQEIQWGSATFNPSTLVLNAATANNVLNFQNKFDLNGATRTIAVYANTATISNDIRTTSGTAVGLTKAGSGTLVLAGNNSYDGTNTISAGMLSVGASANLGAAGAGVSFDGGVFQVTGTTLKSFSGYTVSATSGKSAVFDISNAANTFTLDQAMNLGTGGLIKYGAGALVISNTAFSSSGALIVAGSLGVGGGAGTPTLWNLGNASIQYGTNTSSLAMIVTGGGVTGGGIVTNVNQMRIGYTWLTTTGANNNSLSLSNGASVFSVNAITIGYADGQNSNVATNNSLTITGGAADSILNAGAGNLIVGQSGYGNNNNTGAALNNRLNIGTGGIVTNANLIVGYGTKAQGNSSSTTRANYNVATVNGGGKLYSSGDSYIGYSTHAEASTRTNSAVITGANSLWNMGSSPLFVGRVTAGAATGNALMVSSGGVVTNISALIVSANNTFELGAGGQVYAGAVTNAGTMAVGLDKNVTPNSGRLSVTGNLNVSNAKLDVSLSGTPTAVNVIASYGSLTGSFSVTNGLSDKYKLEMNYKGQNQIAIVYTAAGTIITIF